MSYFVKQEDDKLVCAKYSGHVQTQEALPTFNSNNVKPWDLYLSTNLFQIILSSDTYRIFLLYEHRAATEKEFPPLPFKEYLTYFSFSLVCPLNVLNVHPATNWCEAAEGRLYELPPLLSEQLTK